jgi:predicted RNase H-like nuclease (RuvC/YqgF family)
LPPSTDNIESNPIPREAQFRQRLVSQSH